MATNGAAKMDVNWFHQIVDQMDGSLNGRRNMMMFRWRAG